MPPSTGNPAHINVRSHRRRHHWTQEHVRGHVLVCAVAYLFEQWPEVLYARYTEGEIAKARMALQGNARSAEVDRPHKGRLTCSRCLCRRGSYLADLTLCQPTRRGYQGQPGSLEACGEKH